MKAVNIVWDVGYEEEDRDNIIANLPTTIELPEGMEDEEDINNYLSDEVGWLHCGYDLVD